MAQKTSHYSYLKFYTKQQDLCPKSERWYFLYQLRLRPRKNINFAKISSEESLVHLKTIR